MNWKKTMLDSCKVVGKALKIAARASWEFVKTPLGSAVTMIGAVTVGTTVMLSVQLVDFVTVDEHEFRLSSNAETAFDVFSAEYENALGEISVSGMNGDKVIAPGTSEEYTLRFRNADDIAIDYILTPKVSYTSEHTIPIMVRMLDENDNYIIGDSKTWVAIQDIEALPQENTLRKGQTAEYFFQWKWDYESGNDALDTELGNSGKAAGVSVEMAVHAEANTVIGENGGVTESGLGEIVTSSISLLTLGGAGALIIVFIVKKRKGIL